MKNLVLNLTIKNTSKLVLFCSMLFFLSPSKCVSIGALSPEDVQIRFKEGLKLVEQFYEVMLSDLDEKNCPDIFNEMSGTTSPAKRKREVALVWRFVRENKALFIDRYDTVYPPEKFFRNAGKGYKVKYSASPEFTGPGGIEIFITTVLGSESGINKEVSFPIGYCKNREAFCIDVLAIRVNGIKIEIKTLKKIKGFGEYERNFDWIKRLGFE